ncbi:hypothetical protein DESME_06675 [Calderihabitans maritimus]|uniref:BON domain-containing protein n=2 Tax=Calderihabitans maritimus TaxID=1246530 RepID=A0A1Z5HWG9_9FIRM|nr:hypothetical protein DESME_06675 [Calderihabitans maritimus]
MRLDSFNIDLKVKNGVVQMMGVVDVLAEKERAEELVSSIPGVRRVENYLTVATDGTISDEEIVREIRRRLEKYGDEVLRQVQVEVKGGVAVLKGSLQTLAQKHALVKACQEVKGVKTVRSELQVQLNKRDDASITNAVELALSRNPQVDVKDVVTFTKDGEVTLTGIVKFPEEIEAALRAASSVAGVKAVHNRLKSLVDTNDRDYQLTNLLRRKLRDDPRVSPGQVKAFVMEGIAYLSGEVYTLEAKEAAEAIAHNLQGVRGVSNDIFVARH